MPNAARRCLSALIVTLVVVAGAVLLPSAASAGGGATLHGTVLGADGRPTATHVDVRLQRRVGAEWVSLGPDAGYAVSDHVGNYRLADVTPGSYRVEFEQLDHLTHHEMVTLAAGAEHRLDVTLDRGAAITGRVVGPPGGPRVDALVRVFAAVRVAGSTSWRQVDSAFVHPTGEYSASGFPAGTYRVGVWPTNGAYPEEYFDNVARVEDARDLVVAAGGTVAGIDFDLATPPPAAPPATPADPATSAVRIGKRAKVAGQAKVGRVLRVRRLGIRPRDARTTYRWFVGARRVRGAKGASLRLRPVMAGKRVRVRVTARAPGHTKGQVTLRTRTKVRR